MWNEEDDDDDDEGTDPFILERFDKLVWLSFACGSSQVTQVAYVLSVSRDNGKQTTEHSAGMSAVERSLSLSAACGPEKGSSVSVVICCPSERGGVVSLPSPSFPLPLPAHWSVVPASGRAAVKSFLSEFKLRKCLACEIYIFFS